MPLKLTWLVAGAAAICGLVWLAIGPSDIGRSEPTSEGMNATRVEVGSKESPSIAVAQDGSRVAHASEPTRPEVEVAPDAGRSRGDEDSDYGGYGSRAALLEEAERSVKTWALDPEKWISRHLGWEDPGTFRRFERVPIDLLSPGPVDEGLRKEAERVASSFTDSIRLQAEYALRLLDECAVDYAHSRMQRVPSGTKPTRLARQSPEGRSLRYVVLTHISAGDWDYVIDFHSEDYERFQQALDQLAALKEQRRQEVLRVLGVDR